MNWFS